MKESNNKNTIYIMEYHPEVRQFIEKRGYKVYSAYKGNGIVSRVLRELCFRIKLLPEHIWYNRRLLKANPDYILIRDPLITKQYLIWILKKFPNAQVNYYYANLIGKAKHLFPSEVPSGIRIWTYDKGDSEKYQIRLRLEKAYDIDEVPPKKSPKYDVLFVGRDKGRGEYLLDLEKQMKNLGLRTKFLICADGRFSKPKDYYAKQVPYEQIVEWISESKSILNVVMDGQYGITKRDVESVFHDVKLLTTNSHIVDSEVYDPNNVFIIGKQDLVDLPHFLAIPTNRREDLIRKYSLENTIIEMTKD